MKNNLKPLLLLPLLCALGGCVMNDDNPHAIGRAVVRSEGEPNMYDVKDDDAQMDRATRHARRTVPQFVTALRDPQPEQRDFAVKKMFVRDGAAEHIWLTDVKFVGNRFVGAVDNKPLNIKGLKIGDRVSVNPNEISDWLYVDHGRLVGGYTVRVLYSELSPQEKQDFEKDADFRVER